MDFASIINGIPSPEVKQETGDYMQGGLVYCGKCKTARQVRIEVNGVKLVRNCLCKCRAEQNEREIEAFRARTAEYEMHQRMQAAIKDKAYKQWTFAQDDGAEIKMQRVRAYADNFKGALQENLGLLLWGDVGTGKTFAAACVVNELIEHGYRCYMTTFTALANIIAGLRGTEKNEFVQSLNNFHLLVIDDLGAERKSEYMQEMVYQVIDSRYKAGKPLIITTNMTPEQIRNPDSASLARIYSRVDEMTVPVQFTHKRRPEKAVQKLSKLASLIAD